MVKNIVVGNGFTVELFKIGLKYREGSTVVEVDGQALVGETDYVVYERCVAFADESMPPVSEDERKRIIANIKESFRANGIVLKVE